MIILIAAAAENNALGMKGNLPWHLPDDFKHFKLLTTNHFIIMGRKTFESFTKQLPNRTHVIVTHQKNYTADNCIVVSNLQKAIEICPKHQDIYIVGGGEIYNQSIDIADKIELTRVHDSFEADAFFPEIDLNKWKLETENFHPKDEKHNYDFTFQTYIKLA